MTHGPIPPHERAWRHPSELPAPIHEPTSRTGRVLIASTATVGLLLVGFLALSMTPKRLGTAEPTGAVTSLVLTPLGSAAVEDATTPAVRMERVLRVVSTFLTGTVPAGSDTAPGVNRSEPAATAVPSSPGHTASTSSAAPDTAGQLTPATTGAVSPVSEADVMLTSATGDVEPGRPLATAGASTFGDATSGEPTASDPATTSTDSTTSTSSTASTSSTTSTTSTSTTTTTSTTTSTTTIPTSTTVVFTNAEKKFVNG